VCTAAHADAAAVLLQANAVSDKVLDLRKCDYTGKNLSGKTLAGALLSETNLSNTNLQEAVLTKVSAWCQQQQARQDGLHGRRPASSVTVTAG
jgi:uncharacterized protein YjbI with pentapeptide repeats